jgi:cytochrome P450
MLSEVCRHEKPQTAAMNSSAPPADAIAAVTHADPYPWYARLRAGPALARDDALGLWIASRADVVREALSSSDALRVRPLAEAVPRAMAGSPAGEVFGHLVRMNDGAPHAAGRPLLARSLAALTLPDVRMATLAVARRLPMDSLDGYCLDLPVCTVARLLGFADDALPRVAAWMRDFVACLSPLSTPAQREAAGAAAESLMARFERLVAQRPAPHASLLTAVRAEAPVDHSRALLANLVGLLSQTCEATAGLIGNALVALAREPGLRRRIDGRWSLLPALIDEVARHDPPVQNTRRFVARATTLAGVALRPGDAVLLVLGAANRDPAINPAPATFELMRAERQNLGFGHGPHACPGQALAAAIATVGVERLLAEGLAPVSPGERGWRYRRSVNVRIPVFD